MNFGRKSDKFEKNLQKSEKVLFAELVDLTFDNSGDVRFIKVLL